METNTESTILEAAEKIFIEKGYAATRTTEIAKEAGVNHAMLHYYFRTKENLFNKIFEKKAAQLISFFIVAFDSDLPFFEKLRYGIGMHFDFLNRNRELPLFILREISHDKERREMVVKGIYPYITDFLHKMTSDLQAEKERGTVRDISPLDLLLNIVSLNVFSFVGVQIFYGNEKDNRVVDDFLERRKQNNAEVIISSIKR